MSEFAGRISRPRPERAGTGVATRPATRTPAGVPIWDPLDLNPYLYFDAAVNVSASGGSVSLWYGQWYGGSAPSNGLANYLKQGTAEWQPTHSTDGYIQFDAVDTRLEYDPATTQAGVLICATDNGCFAYEVDADSIDEVTALGWEKGYFQALKLYAMVLLPATVTDVQIAGVIDYLITEKGATKNPTGSLASYWRGRTDLVTPKFAALDFSGVTDFTDAWQSCTSLTSFPALNLSRGTSFNWAWYNTGLLSFPALDLSAALSLYTAWYYCDEMISWGACDVTACKLFGYAWSHCTAMTTFPAGVFDDWNPASVANSCFENAWSGCTALTATSVENILNSLATAGNAAPSSGVDIPIDYNAGTGTPSVATAVGILKGLSPAWTITLNGTPQ